MADQNRLLQSEHDQGQLPEPRGAFGGFIGPKNLLHLVRSTAPWLLDGKHEGLPTPPSLQGERLYELGHQALGWWAILLRAQEGDLLLACEEPTDEQWTDYFALCVAAHFGTVATYVPTDVDTKIRDRLWFRERPAQELEALREFTLATAQWDISPVSRRIVDVKGFGPISGHDGEHLSILCGGLLGLHRAEDLEGAKHFTETIEREVRREAEGFEQTLKSPGHERDLLVLAASLTHNAGDIDQGLSARKGRRFNQEGYVLFGRLAHERPERFNGVYLKAAKVYKQLLSSEGHRHYPLREIRCLRSHPDLLFPIGPFLDDWGALLASWPAFGPAEHADIVGGLLAGVRRVKGQQGYQRALAGFDQAYPGGIAALSSRLPASGRRLLRDPGLRQAMAVRQISFESSLAKQAMKICGA